MCTVQLLHGNELPAKLRRYVWRGAAASKKVQHNVARVWCHFDDALHKFDGFFCRVSRALFTVDRYACSHSNITPPVVRYSTFFAHPCHVLIRPTIASIQTFAHGLVSASVGHAHGVFVKSKIIRVFGIPKNGVVFAVELLHLRAARSGVTPNNFVDKILAP